MLRRTLRLRSSRSAPCSRDQSDRTDDYHRGDTCSKRECLTCNCPAEYDRDDWIHVRISAEPRRRDFVEQPDVRRKPDQGAEYDQVDPPDPRGRRYGVDVEVA